MIKWTKLTGMELAMHFQSLGPSFWTSALSLSSCKKKQMSMFMSSVLIEPSLIPQSHWGHMQISAGQVMTNHLLLSPFHLHFATISLLRHIRVGVLMHGLLSILTEKQTNKQTAVMCTVKGWQQSTKTGLWSALVAWRGKLDQVYFKLTDIKCLFVESCDVGTVLGRFYVSAVS